MVIQLSKLFRITVAGLLDADGTTLVLDETTGNELVTTLAGALGLTVGAAGEEAKTVEVESVRFNPRVGDYMWRTGKALEAQAWEVIARNGDSLRVVFYLMDGTRGGERSWPLDVWSGATDSYVYERGDVREAFKCAAAAVAQKRAILAEAVAAAISAPAVVVKPAFSDAPPPLADRAQSVQRIHAYLTECGAATVNDVADDLGYDRSGVHKSLTQHNDLFATAGRRAVQNSRLKPPMLWDLRERVTVNAPVTCAEKIVAHLQEHESATAKTLVGAIGADGRRVGFGWCPRDRHEAGGRREGRRREAGDA